MLIIGQWPEDFDFEITRAINAPHPQHAHARDSPEVDEDEKKSKEVVEIAAAENDESDKELDPVGLHKAFRFAAWSSIVLVGSFSHLSDGIETNLNSDGDNDHSHSASLVFLFNRLRRGRIVRQVERLIRLRWFACTELTWHVLFFLYHSLGDYRDDLDLLLRVHGSPVPALGISGSSYSNRNRTCQGTVSFLLWRSYDPAELPFFLFFVFRTCFLPEVESSRVM